MLTLTTVTCNCMSNAKSKAKDANHENTAIALPRSLLSLLVSMDLKVQLDGWHWITSLTISIFISIEPRIRTYSSACPNESNSKPCWSVVNHHHISHFHKINTHLFLLLQTTVYGFLCTLYLVRLTHKFWLLQILVPMSRVTRHTTYTASCNFLHSYFSWIDILAYFLLKSHDSL